MRRYSGKPGGGRRFEENLSPGMWIVRATSQHVAPESGKMEPNLEKSWPNSGAERAESEFCDCRTAGANGEIGGGGAARVG